MKQFTTYRMIGTVLFLNNLAGIILNFELTFMSCIVLLGVPGIVFFGIYCSWTFYPKSRHYNNYIILSFLMILYNLLIYFITEDTFNHDEFMEVMKPQVFPIVNMALCGLLFLVAVGEALSQKPEVEMTQSFKRFLWLTFYFCAAMVLLFIVIL
jgi:hypothetical protein